MLWKYQHHLMIFLSLTQAIEGKIFPLKKFRTFFEIFFFSEPCNYLDNLVHYHLTNIPNQIFEAQKVAKKQLGFRVGKSYTQGISLLTGMVFDIT